MSCKVSAGLLLLGLIGCGPKPDAPVEVAVQPAPAPKVAPSPVVGPFQPPSVIPKFQDARRCQSPICIVGGFHVAVFGREAAPVDIWEQTVAKGSKLSVPLVRKDITTFMILLAGAVELNWDRRQDLPNEGAGALMQPLDGIGIIENGFSLLSLEKGTRLLFVSVQHPPDMKGRKPASRVFAFSLRGGTNLAWGDDGYGARIEIDQSVNPDSVASVGFLGIGSPKGVAEHVHENEWELLAILSGAGTMTVGKGAEAKKVAVRPGSLVTIPKGTPHAFAPTELPVTAIQLYAPPGPEQRFKKLAAPK